MKSLSSRFAPLALARAASTACAFAVDVDPTPFIMPPGCSCARSGMTNDEQCDQFDCLDEEEEYSPLVKMCVERPPSLESVNLKYPLRLSDSPEDKLLGLMCVEKDNSAVKGNFFEDQGYPSASQVFSPGGKGSKQLGFHSHNQEIGPVRTNADYQLGDPIAAYHRSGQELKVAFGGYFILPSADDGGNCIELNAVSFGQSETGACSKSIDNLAVSCERHLNTARYISNIFVEQTKGSVIFGVPSQASLSDGLLSIRISKFTDSDGSTSIDLDGIPHQTSWEESSICANALKSLLVNVRHNNTAIIDISAEIETIDVENSTGELQQEFAVNFFSIENESSEDQNNTITLIPSGSPGYISGKPTLGAISPNVNHTGSYVIARNDGFTVMDTGLAGQCSSSSPKGSPVGFRENIFVGCTQSFTREELSIFCTSNSNENLSSHKVGADHFMFPKWLQNEIRYLGIFGNADPLDRRQWIKIESPLDDPGFTIKSRTFVEAENRCIGMPTRLKYEILWTYVGNIDNPQAKILSAKKSFEDGPSLQHTLPQNEKQPFSFITTVSWTFSQPNHAIVKSPPPFLLLSVPHDVFYPFQMNSGNL